MPSGLTGYGALLFLICLLLAGSGVQQFRDTLSSIINSRKAGMSVHPYLIVVAFVFPLVILQRITIVPRSFIAAFVVFCTLTYVSTFYGGVDLQELVKISATFLTIVTSALLVRTREDFVAGVVGMCIGVGVLTIIGVEGTEGIGDNLIGGTGRNTFSLFSLPMMFMGGYVVTRIRRTPVVWNVVIVTAIAVAMIGMILSLNRSGWLGAGIIALLLLPGSRMRGLVIIGAVALSVVVFFRDPVEQQSVRERFTQTIEGNNSDELRKVLIKESVEIALEAPLLGVSPQHLPVELARRLGHSDRGISTHNVLAHVMAGSGIPCLFSLLAIGGLLWRWRIDPKASPPIAKRFRDARQLLRMMLVLWLARGMFTHEILYAPAFSLALGMCIGLCLRYSSVDALQSASAARGLRPQGQRRRRRLRVSAGLEM